MKLRMMTANRLTDGAVVYLAANGGWTEFLYEGRIAETDAEAERLSAPAQKAVEDRCVIGPYLIEIIDDCGFVRPARLREAIRAEGPTVGGAPAGPAMGVSPTRQSILEPELVRL